MNDITTDLHYTYPRKTETKNGILKFSFEHDLQRKITEPDLADMILFCCQRDVRLQKIIQQSSLTEEDSIEKMLAIVNAYREVLLFDNFDNKVRE